MRGRAAAERGDAVSAGEAKEKPASHAFRKGTDAVRQAYRHQRSEALGPRLSRRRRLAAQLAPEAILTLGRDEGYAIVPPGTVPVQDLIDVAHDTLARANLAQKTEEANKPFLVKLSERHELTLGSPLLRFGLRRDLIATAATYLGMVPILQYAHVLYSAHAMAEPAKSQLYHCDSDEGEQVKVFVLCDQVTPASGPLTMLSAARSQTVRDHFGYKYNQRLTDDQVYEALGSRDLVHTALVGPAGTTAFIDTSRCMHYGSRFLDTTAHRLVVMLQYVTPLAFILPEEDFLSGARFRALATSGMDEVTRLVLGAQ